MDVGTIQIRKPAIDILGGHVIARSAKLVGRVADAVVDLARCWLYSLRPAKNNAKRVE